jgi:capsular exopolysaccharide synthesis family protein
MINGQFDLRDLLGLLRRRFRMVALTVVLVLAGTSAVILALKPIYTASALVMVDPTRKDLLDPESQFTGTSSDSARVDSEVELVKSPTTLMSVVKDMDLIKDSEFGVKLGLNDMVLAFLRITQPSPPSGDDALQRVMERLRQAISVQRRGLTYLIAIDVESRDPQRAADIANSVAETYIHAQLDSKVTSTLASRNIIQGRIAEASTAVADSERSFDTFIENNIDRISAETGRTDLAALRQRLDNANTTRSNAAALAEMVDSSLKQRDWQSIANELKNEAVNKLVTDRSNLQQSLAGLAEGSQGAINLKAELTKLDAQLADAAQTQLTTLRQRAATAQSQASDVRGQLRSTILDSDLPAEVLTSIYELQQNAEIARSQYQTLLQRLKDLEAQAYLQVADSRIVSQALPPSRPSFPNPPLILSLAGISALGLGIGLAFLVENFVGGFTSEEQLLSIVRTSATAAVPRQRDGKPGAAENVGIADHIITSPLSVFAEAVRRVRLTLDQALLRNRTADGGGGSCAVIMVSSATSGEGKTTLALSMARAYALSGRSTLLIDCDLRKPGIHWQLGLEPSSGLLEYLVNADDAPPLASIMAVDEGSGAQIVVGSRRSDIATDQLLSGSTFARLIRAARESFDVVILDTPPIGPVVDGLYLVQHADVVAFVVRWASTSQQDVRSAIASLNQAKRPQTEIVAVLNRQDMSRSSYYSKYAGYYSEA